MEKMRGKTVVITGATSGIGQVAAELLAKMGARIVQVARNKSRGVAALERLRSLAPGIDHTIHYADLSRVSEMKRVAEEISQAEPRIDVLINNAGAVYSRRQVTEDGLELTFALNHMSYFVLTHLLLERLKTSAPSRVVCTASDAHRGYKLDLDDLQSEKNYQGFPVYGRSKLANILFTSELARRLAGSGVTANSLHPGFVATRYGDESGGMLAFGIRVAKRFAISPEKGAQTIIYLASSPEVAGKSGGYFYKCRPHTPTAAGRDDAVAARLWSHTAKLAGMSEQV